MSFCVLVCGGRDYDDAALVENTLNGLYEDHARIRIINGGAPGADHLSTIWAIGRQVEHQEYPASWGLYGRRAGPIRNQYMLEVGRPDVVVAFPGGRGTADMVRRARAAGVPVFFPTGTEPVSGRSNRGSVRATSATDAPNPPAEGGE